MSIDINCDIGEGYGVWAVPSQKWRMELASNESIDCHDLDGAVEAIIGASTSVNIACGMHAGDPFLLKRYIQNAVKQEKRIGAHPSYPDREGFGLRYMDIQPAELKAIIQYQISAIDGLVKMMGSNLKHVKCHGALYNRSMEDISLAKVVVEAVQEYDQDLIIYGLPGSEVEAAAASRGLEFWREVFGDRGYHENGQLVSRLRDDALLIGDIDIRERVESIVQRSEIISVEGTAVKIQADTICFHGDTPGAQRNIEIARMVAHI